MLQNGYLDLPRGKIAAVVTSLEMTKRVVAYSDPSIISWQLMPQIKPDPDWYQLLFERVGREWLWFSRLRMSSAELKEIIWHPDVLVFSVRHEGHDEGLLELDFRTPGDCELAFFGLTAKLRGAGAGRWLLNRALEAAWARPIRKLWVHTCTLDHPSALKFYRNAGFVPVSRQIELADDPRSLGVLPHTAAPDIPLL